MGSKFLKKINNNQYLVLLSTLYGFKDVPRDIKGIFTGNMTDINIFSHINWEYIIVCGLFFIVVRSHNRLKKQTYNQGMAVQKALYEDFYPAILQQQYRTECILKGFPYDQDEEKKRIEDALKLFKNGFTTEELIEVMKKHYPEMPNN
ncbi:hypothetical protein [Chitinophaga sp. CB10]|uniref:hypothetical protein n=1 Tax=Chitinophaga sp. CB10 TaxID=1891659 RepID=UPI0025BED24B|nr:hypothetical protein [Chitinophaga sp. CB10]